MFYYSILMYNEMNGQWLEWEYLRTEEAAKEEFSRLTRQGYTVKVLYCRDVNSGKDWIGEKANV